MQYFFKCFTYPPPKLRLFPLKYFCQSSLSDGQKLAKNLAISIGKKSKSINDVLGPLNQKVKYPSKEIKELHGKEIDVEIAKDCTSNMYSNISHQENASVPADVKHRLIHLYC